jgi:general secretion pathway protein D
MQRVANQLAGDQNFGAKEADGIGMTRRTSLLFARSSGWMDRGRLAALLVLLGGLTLAPSARAQSASTWNKRGQTAELRQDYDTAYEDYLKAHQKSLKDMRYQTRLDRMRFQAAAQHVDRGRVLRQSGDLAGALNQFTRALEIDPSNEAAAQEIQITRRMDQPAGGASAIAPGTAESQAALRDIADVSAPLQLKPVSNDPITLNITETAKNIYLAIGKLAGLNVIFDPDFDTSSAARNRIPVDLRDVSLMDALRIVGMEAGTFYKPVTADTIFVAQVSKHTTLDDLAIQTFYLTNPSQASDANELQTTIRNVLPTDAKVFLIPSQNALVVRATPDQLTLVQKLLNDLDRAKAEVVVDVAILEVNRDTVRNLGITLPQSFGITPQASSGTTTTATTTTTGSTSTSPSSFTLNTLANTNATNFAVTIGGGTLNALYSDADTRVLQNPSIRATDGQQATLKIGSKIPVATGSYSAGAATGITAGIGVQTQFTYLDVGVNIDMTPTIHLDREVSLKLTVEVLSETGSVTISGVTEPIIGQRSDKAVIQLRDGEPCLLAGLLEDSYTYNNTGTPGLSQIPFLKYLFGTINKEITKDEIVFVLIPHIVRESVLTNLNTRAIDTGTAGSIELRRGADAGDNLAPAAVNPAAPAPTTTAANAAAGMVQQLRQQAMPPMPGGGAAAASMAPAPAAAAGPPVAFSVLPVNSTQAVGSTFRASVVASNAHDLFYVPLQVQFDPKVLQLVNVDTGGLLGGDGQPVALTHRDDGSGMVSISASRPPNVKGVDGQGEVCILTFKAIAAGDSNIALVKVGAKNSSNASLPAVGAQATVHVK